MFSRKQNQPSQQPAHQQPNERPEEPKPPTVGALHKFVRAELLNLSEAEMCQFYGLGTTKALSDYESGAEPFPLPYLKRFCEFFFVREGFLETGEGRVFDSFRVNGDFVRDHIKKYGFKPWFFSGRDPGEDLECFVVLHRRELGYDRIITSGHEVKFGYHKSADYFRGLINALIEIGQTRAEEWVHVVDRRTWASLEKGTFYRKGFNFANADWRCRELYEGWFDDFYHFRRDHVDGIEVSRLTDGVITGLYEWLLDKINSLPGDIRERIFLAAEPALLEFVRKLEPGMVPGTPSEVVRRVNMHFRKMRTEDRVGVLGVLAGGLAGRDFALEVEVQAHLFAYGFRVAGDSLVEADKYDRRQMDIRKRQHEKNAERGIRVEQAGSEAEAGSADSTAAPVEQPSPGWDVGVIIALQEEFEEFASCVTLEPLERDVSQPHYYYGAVRPDSGSHHRYNCVVEFVGDMGNTYSAIHAERLILKYNPKTIVMLGIAAGIHEDVKLGDVVAASLVDNYLEASKVVDEAGGTHYKINWGGGPQTTNSTLLSGFRNFKYAYGNGYRRWLAACEKNLGDLLTPEERNRLIGQGLLEPQAKHHVVHLASGPLVVTSPAFVKQLHERDRAYKALDMESGGVVMSSHRRDIPVRTLVLRGISDRGDARKAEVDAVGKGALRRYAMRNATELLWALLEEGGLPRHETPTRSSKG
jgi:nucleoside phosphorylase